MLPIKMQSNRSIWNQALRVADQRVSESPSHSLLGALKESNTQAGQSRKSAAKARMAELKQRLDNLLRFAGVGKGNPRIVAELAKELKALVAQYGGSTPGDAVASKLTLNTESQHDTAQNPQSETSSTETEGRNPEKSAEQASTAPAHLALHVAGRGRDPADQAFLSEAKQLASRIKQLLAQENRKLKTEIDQHELKAAKKAITELDAALKEAEQGNAAAPNGENIAATTYDASGASNESAVASPAGISIFA
ncbi:hypothetical protein NT239_08755 [Chitinibacter sp. SCUT-21]|uniref:hypothetical protein n=1 Tax=Chitinibacter sp. SCUT-21 TaxID=2970891 RepID=UPI0035A706E3